MDRWSELWNYSKVPGNENIVISFGKTVNDAIITWPNGLKAILCWSSERKCWNTVEMYDQVADSL